MSANISTQARVPIWLTSAIAAAVIYVLLMVGLTRYVVPDMYDNIDCSRYWVAVPSRSEDKAVDVNPSYKLRVWLLTLSNTSGYFVFEENYWVNLAWGALPAAILGGLAGTALTTSNWKHRIILGGVTLLSGVAYVVGSYWISGLWMAVRMDCWMWP